MNTEIKKIRKFCCSTCGVEGHNKNNTKFHPAVPVVKDRFTCETCETKCDRLIEYCGLSGEEWQVCEDCEIKFDEERDVDDPDMPNVAPYKKCYECEERSSCGSYDEDMHWICEGCAPEEDLDVDDERCFGLRPDDDDEEELICPHCNRNEEECEKNTESVKNPITHWCGWGLSCDDCYYKNHPDDDDEDESGDTEGYCSICGEGCKLCYRRINGVEDDSAPEVCKYCLAKLEDEEEEVGCTDC